MQQGWNNTGIGSIGSMGFIGSGGIGFQHIGDSVQQGLLGPTYEVASGRTTPISPQECTQDSPPSAGDTPIIPS